MGDLEPMTATEVCERVEKACTEADFTEAHAALDKFLGPFFKFMIDQINKEA